MYWQKENNFLKKSFKMSTKVYPKKFNAFWKKSILCIDEYQFYIYIYGLTLKNYDGWIGLGSMHMVYVCTRKKN